MTSESKLAPIRKGLLEFLVLKIVGAKSVYVPDILRQLAVKAGIAPRWTEQTGAEREVSAQSLRVILQALGLPAGTDADLRQSLATVEAGANLSAQSRFTTARTGQPVVP